MQNLSLVQFKFKFRPRLDIFGSHIIVLFQKMSIMTIYSIELDDYNLTQLKHYNAFGIIICVDKATVFSAT